MNTLAPNSTINALINMLDDPDDRVYRVVHDKLLSMGKVVLPPLEDAIGNCFTEFVEERMIAVRDHIYQQDLETELTRWHRNSPHNLLDGFLLVSTIGERNLDEVDIMSQIAQIKTDVWIELHDGLTAMENVKVINHVLFKIHKFMGSKEDITAPENFYLHTLLKYRKGSPLTLGILYIIISHQLGLPIFGVNLPQHFILAYLSEDGIDNPTAADVLFYINPFNNGAMFSRHEIDHFIGQLKIKPEPSFYSPCSTADIIRRLLNNLLFSFKSKGYENRVWEIENLLNVIK